MVFGPECDRVGVDLGIRLPGQYGHDARVEPTGEEARDGDVCDEMGVHRVFDPPAGRSALRAAAASSTTSQYARLAGAIWAEFGPTTGLELLDALHRAHLVRDPVVEHGCHQSLRTHWSSLPKAPVSALSSEANTTPSLRRM